MKFIGELLIIESQDDYKHGVIYEREDSIRLDKIGVIYHNGNKIFPQFYKYSAPYDGHFCAEYFKVDEQEAYEIIKDYIEKRQQEINSLLLLLPQEDDYTKKQCQADFSCRYVPYSMACETCDYYYSGEEWDNRFNKIDEFLNKRNNEE